MIKITATEAQNNFGKYLKLCRRESIMITRNGKRQAMLVNFVPDEEGIVSDINSVYGTSPKQNPEWVTYSKFVEMDEDNEGRYELIDGEIFELASPTFSHQRILGAIYNFLHEYFSESEQCDVFFAPLDIFLVREPNRNEEDILEFYTNIVQPDLQVLCDYEKDIDEKGRYRGTPNLVVEVLSPSTRTKDIWKKLNLYSECGIAEYWIVDPEKKSIAVYTFPEADSRPTAVFRDAQIAYSGFFKGLKVPLKELF